MAFRDRLHLTRRTLVLGASSALVAGSYGPDAAAVTARQTPRQTMGPFYPRRRPSDHDADLTRVRGRAGIASGAPIMIFGQVRLASGTPQAGALVEIWQADSFGHYHHPGDGGADPNFQGFGAVSCNREGRYLFRTIRPGYYGAGSFVRTPHIHFRIVGDGPRELVTQLYFPGERLNAQDGLLQSLTEAAARKAVTAREMGVDGVWQRYRFDIILAA